MGQHCYPEMLHRPAVDGALRDRAVVLVDRRRDALKGRAVLLRLWRHGIKQKPQRRLDILAVDPVIFLIRDAAAVIDDAVDHQGRSAAPGLDPGGTLHLLQIGRAQVEMPQRVAVLRLKAHRRRRARHPLVIVTPLPEIAVGGRFTQQTGRQANRTIGRLDPVLFQDADRLHCRKMPAFAVEGPQLHRRERLAVTFEFRCRDDFRLAAIGAVQRARVKLSAQPAVEGRPRHAIKRRSGRDHALAIGMPRRQRLQPVTQADQRLVGNTRPGLSHSPLRDSCRASVSRYP
jgi:hypothetical protein